MQNNIKEKFMHYFKRVFIILLLCIHFSVYAIAQEKYTAGKWETLAEEHWQVVITENNAEKTKTSIQILIFGENTIFIFARSPCGSAEPDEERLVTFSSKSRSVSISGCSIFSNLNQFQKSKVAILKEQLYSSALPAEVLNVLSRMPFWNEKY